MIFAERKPLEEIIGSLNGHKRILLVGCATCVAECAAGGEREVETLAPLLKLALGSAVNPLQVDTAVPEKQCEWEFIEELADRVGQVDAVVSLACGIGVQAMAERYPDTPIIPGVNTSALTMREELGVWASRCAACGDCILGETFGLCPIARCAKSLLNGPCGGTTPDGKCEVDPATDCIWTLIVERAAAQGQVERLRQVRAPKSWANSRKLASICSS